MDPWPMAATAGLLVGVVTEAATRRVVSRPIRPLAPRPTGCDTRQAAGPGVEEGPRDLDLRPVPRRAGCSPWWPGTMAAAWVATALTDAPPVSGGTAGTLVRLAVVTLLVAAARIDVAERRLPDALTLPATALCLTAAAPALLGDADAARALLAAAVVPLVLLGVTLTAGGIGFGDVKAGAPVGALLGLHGWVVLVIGLCIAWAGAAAVAIVLLARGARRDTPIPLGPFLLLGTIAAPLLT